ncbi:ubiquitin carboxyl-terminal hydrolase 19 [Rhincodon typus]|uniref:ubiquitin carboxyl-terminal hydrolase 19 n=1 Tax=Rhincodon typus TaxID=259920 RepID=UPI00202E72CB|nr:ubiquitin carboxyl-terminal hydrolase 19 [Rhincodon typus]
MASTAENRKKLGWNQEETTNKKKLKDKVNQENKDGKTTVGSEPKKDLPSNEDALQGIDSNELFIDWKQNADEVIVKLKSGEGNLKVDEVDAAFTDTDCVVTLPDGCRWSCHFYEEIESSCSKLQYKEKGNFLQLIMPKKIPLRTWPSLMKKGKEQTAVILPRNTGKEKTLLSEEVTEEVKPGESSDSTEKRKTKAERRLKRPINVKVSGKMESPPEPGVKRTIQCKDPDNTPVIPEPVPTQTVLVKPPEGVDAAFLEKDITSAVCPKSLASELRTSDADGGLTDPLVENKVKRNGRGPQGDWHMEDKSGMANTVRASAEKAEIDVTEKEKLLPKNQDVNTVTDGFLCEAMAKSSNVGVPMEQIVSAAEFETREPAGDRLGLSEIALEEPLAQSPSLHRNLVATSFGKQTNSEQITGETLPMERPLEDAAVLPSSAVGNTSQKKEDAKDQVEVPDSYVNLSFVKYDSYEKGTDAMVVHVYVKEICKSVSKVLFREQDFTLIFQTSHEPFLRIHPDCGPNTIFKWQVKVRTCQMNHWSDHKNQCRAENIGCPFIISVPESRLTYSRLSQLLEGYSRYSVNVFQPPFQPGRISPDPPPCKMENVQPSPGTTTSSEIGDGKIPLEIQERDFRPVHRTHLTSSVSEPLLASAFSKGMSMPGRDKDSIHSYDSGFSEMRPLSQEDTGCEKETAYEKAPKPEAAIPGYQQPVESVRFHTPQFYIKIIDASNKEQKMEDKGDAPLELPDSVTLAMVWKNNERQKEYVLVESKELEYIEDPSSANEAARAGYFTLEQCLNLFTKPEVLAPEEAW